MIPLLCGDAPKRPCSTVRPAGVDRARGWALTALAAAFLFCGFSRAAESGGSVAKITSLQNQVETRGAEKTAWNPSTLNQSLAGHDRVRTGAASRASILYSDQTLHRLNEKSEVEILPPAGDSPGLLKILSGQHYFSSRTPKDYGRIETPTVTAAIKGTEFMVDVAPDSSTTITMLEGTVVAANEQGNLEVHQGEQAYVEPGKAPVKRILVHPRDAVAWSFYYPPVLGGADAQRLKDMGAEGESLSHAAELLSTGQVEAANSLIDQALKAHPKDATALSLASVVQTAQDHRDEASRLAQEAMTADPNSAAAALAGSYAAQASFDIEKATTLAEKAVEIDPASVTAQSRVAELYMAQGDVKKARRAAQAAVGQAPTDARALSVLGFVELAEFNTETASSFFERAVAADSTFPLAHLGLGITRIRMRHVESGREELQTAVSLDPGDSLLRSYLGKAYYEERRSVEASKELKAAKELDPHDPTPYLYDAILKQNENRPVEALDDMQESIKRNDRRAVYRSRLLLDQDTAIRATDIARIYNDLGFEQLGLVTGRRSADENHANFSSHLLLAGNYRIVPNYSPAFLSEVLQARIYQPANVNAARPDVVNESNVSFNEYTALFDRPRARAFGGLTYGRTDTDLSELGPPGLIDPISLDDSGFYDGDVTGTLNGDHYAASLSYRKLDDDGFRINNDQRLANYRGFFEYSPNYRDSYQINLLYGRRETGDQPLREIPAAPRPERIESELDNIGLGYHRNLSASAHLVVSAIYNRLEQAITDPTISLTGTGVLEGPQVEAQGVFQMGRSMSWVVGIGGFDGTVELEQPGADMEGNDTYANGYGYVRFRDFGPFEFTLGASVEHVDSPNGLIPAQDSGIVPAEISFSETRVSPKAGISVYLPSKTTLRAAGYYRLSPNIGRLQTVEPTQVAGFNQFFDEPGGTRSLSYGLGVDQEFGSRLFGGFSVLRRELTIPQAYCSTEDPFSACAFQVADIIDKRDSTDDYLTAYFNATIGRFVAAGVDYTHERYDFEPAPTASVRPFKDFIETQRVRPQARIFLPRGFFASIAATRYDQQVDQFDDLTSSSRSSINSKFWIADALVGYKFPRRYGSVILQARNLGDREFDFFERTVQETVIPARTVSLRVNFTF